jgi:hypothetical protein
MMARGGHAFLFSSLHYISLHLHDKQGHIQIQGNRREGKDSEVAFVGVCCPDGDIVAELRACFMSVGINKS